MTAVVLAVLALIMFGLARYASASGRSADERMASIPFDLAFVALAAAALVAALF